MTTIIGQMSFSLSDNNIPFVFFKKKKSLFDFHKLDLGDVRFEKNKKKNFLHNDYVCLVAKIMKG